MTRLPQLLERAKPFYENDDPGHDFAHVRRVMTSCEAIGRLANADLAILLPAAVLHDVVNLPKNHPERHQASQRAAARSREILQEAGFSGPEIEAISQVIVEHSYSLGKAPTTTEAAVLQDADRLDALGAIGIMRTVSCGCRLGASYYDESEPFAVTRRHDDKAFTLDHFYTKLLKLPELMNTDAGRAEANRRVEFMDLFIGQLKREIGPYGRAAVLPSTLST